MTKSEYKVLYRYQTCPFVPTKDVPFEEMPDVVEGAVLFVEEGEYNPSGWYKPIVVKKSALRKMPLSPPDPPVKTQN